MAKIPVDEAPAGPEMDAACAEAMGHQVYYCDIRKQFFVASSKDAFEEMQERSALFVNTCSDKPARYCQRLPKPSTRIEHAWQLVESDDWPESWVIDPEGKDGAWIYEWEWLDEQNLIPICGGNPASLAISRAFLKAKGVTEIEVPE